MENEIYVYVRKYGRVYYDKDYMRTCYKIPLSEALKQGYRPSKENERIKVEPYNIQYHAKRRD